MGAARYGKGAGRSLLAGARRDGDGERPATRDGDGERPSAVDMRDGDCPRELTGLDRRALRRDAGGDGVGEEKEKGWLIATAADARGAPRATSHGRESTVKRSRNSSSLLAAPIVVSSRSVRSCVVSPPRLPPSVCPLVRVQRRYRSSRTVGRGEVRRFGGSSGRRGTRSSRPNTARRRGPPACLHRTAPSPLVGS